MAVTHIDTNTVNNSPGSSNTPTLTVTKPSGTQQGDLLIAYVYKSTTDLTDTPNGWTLLDDRQASTVLRMFVYYKVAGPSEPSSYSWDAVSGNTHGAGVSCFRGIDPNNPINDDAGATYTTQDPATAPSLTTTVGGCHIYTVRSTRNDVLTEVTHSASDTELSDHGADNGTNARTAASYFSGPKPEGNVAGLSVTMSGSSTTHGIMVSVAIAPLPIEGDLAATAPMLTGALAGEVDTDVEASAGHAPVTAAANIARGHAPIQAIAYGATVVTEAGAAGDAGHAPVTVLANDPTLDLDSLASAGHAPVTVVTEDPTLDLDSFASAGHAGATAAAEDATAETDTDAPAGHAPATALANDATIDASAVEVNAGHASVSTLARNADADPVAIPAAGHAVQVGAVANDAAVDSNTAPLAGHASVMATAEDAEGKGTVSGSLTATAPAATFSLESGISEPPVNRVLVEAEDRLTIVPPDKPVLLFEV